MRRLIKGVAVATLTAAVLTAPVFADTIGGAKVSTKDTGLNLRTEATTASKALAEIPNGTFLLVEEARSGWYKVAYNGLAGYVSSDYATFSENMEGTYSYEASTRGTDVNVRSGASLVDYVLNSLPKAGTRLTITGVSGNWLHIRDNGGVAGFIRSDLVNYLQEQGSQEENSAPLVAAAEEAAASELGRKVAKAAEDYLGCAYTWGGISPETGFDCSGFVNYLYNLYGVKLNRVAQDIYNNNGEEVSRDELQPGDLLFFGNSNYSIGHVGVYVGNNEMIHASTYTTGVIRSALDGNYGGTLVGAKRITE